MNNFLERESVILRYGEHLNGIEARWLRRATIQEGMEVIYGYEYKDVVLGILDLSTYAATGTFKSSVACVTVAECLQRNVRRFITQSSGNTANALALYASVAEIPALILYPAASRYKIDPKLGESPFVRLVEFMGSEEELKLLIQEYSEVSGVPWLPTMEMQVKSNKLRAYFLADCEAKHNVHFAWHVQALSSGWGVFGFYDGTEEIHSKGESLQPRFFGVQQEAVCPFYNYLTSEKPPERIPQIIEPTLFRSQPTPTMLEKMKDIVERSNGRIVRLSNQSYEHYKDLAVQTISEFGVRLGKVRMGDQSVLKEKAGVIAMAAVLQEIDAGLIPEGDNVLICLTGGSGADRATLYDPKQTISPHDGVEALREIGKKFYSGE
jgi:threonine synthase